MVLFASNLHVLSRLGELSGSSVALRGLVGHSEADIPSWRLVLYIDPDSEPRWYSPVRDTADLSRL